MEHIIVKEEERFNVLEVETGYYITDYNTEDSILEYFGSTLMYMPKTIDYTKYYAITEEQHNAYEEEKRRVIEEMEKNNNGENQE